jgi:hypothetical protein
MKNIYLSIIFAVSVSYGYAFLPDSTDSASNKLFLPSIQSVAKKSLWEISGNFGLYLSNGYSAQFYNGNRDNVNNLEYIFSNYYWRLEIKEAMEYNVQRDSFMIYDIPANIKYDPAMHVGFSARRNYTDQIAFNFSMNYSKMRIRDVVLLEVYPAFSGMIESFVYCGIFGEEARTNIDIGLLYTISPEKQTTAFWEFGMNINSTQVKKHFLRVFDRDYNLINIYGSSAYVPNTQLNTYDIRQGGIGFGAYASVGVRYRVSPQFCMELLTNAYMKTVNLEGYNQRFSLHNSFLFRLVISPDFNFSTQEDDSIY